MTDTPYFRGERLLLDRSLQVIFIRHLDDGSAVVEFAGGTRVVPGYALSRSEA